MGFEREASKFKTEGADISTVFDELILRVPDPISRREKAP